MPQIQQTAPKAPAKLGATGTPAVEDTMSAPRAKIYEQIQAIHAEKDPENKLNMISQLAQSSKQFAADTKKAITERVVSESRIPMLKDAIAKEDEGGFSNLVGNVINARFGLPNTGTQLRRNMDDEVQHANKKISMEFEQNPDIVAIAALHDSHGFLATQSTLAGRAISRRENDAVQDVNKQAQLENTRETGKINREAAFANTSQMLKLRTQEREIERQTKKDELEQQLHDAITPEQRDIARAYSGKQPHDTSVDSFLIANVKRDKSFQAVMTQADSPEGMVSLALSGNPQAAKVAVAKQAELLSGETDPMSPKYRAAKATATEDMRFMNKVMSTSEGYSNALDLVYGTKGSDRRKKYESALANETALLSPKDQLAARTNAKAQLAKDALATANKNQFVRSISSWPEQFTTVMDSNPIYQKLVTDKGKNNVSVRDMVTSITAIADPAVRSQQMQNFEFVMQNAAKHNNQAYFGFALDNMAVQMNIADSITRTLKGDLGDAALGAARTFFNPLSHLKEGISKVYDDIDSAYGVTKYIKGQ